MHFLEFRSIKHKQNVKNTFIFFSQKYGLSPIGFWFDIINSTAKDASLDIVMITGL